MLGKRVAVNHQSWLACKTSLIWVKLNCLNSSYESEKASLKWKGD